MRPQKVSDIEVLEGIMSVLRDKGYSGASLNDFAVASGLKKASLYHRFPGGKKEIVQAILEYSDQWLDRSIVAVVEDKSQSPEVRLCIVIDRIKQIYDNGNNSCILKAVSTDVGIDLFGIIVDKHIQKWIASFTTLALDFGFDTEKATVLGTQALIGIQGSLIVTKGLKSKTYFLDTLRGIEETYLKK